MLTRTAMRDFVERKNHTEQKPESVELITVK